MSGLQPGHYGPPKIKSVKCTFGIRQRIFRSSKQCLVMYLTGETLVHTANEFGNFKTVSAGPKSK